ncbi:MAG: hypothetical protein DRP11_05490, partial [Candidatus Aenigmatarchaeota archaeon]
SDRMEDVTLLAEKISERSGLPLEEVLKRIKDKKVEFSGLISAEGAAHIVAKELGVELLKKEEKRLKVSSLVPGMMSVTLKGKIVRIFEPRTFSRESGEGKVCNLLLGDETGVVRVSLWDDQVSWIEEGKVKEGDVIEVINGYVIEDSYRGAPELRIGKMGKIKIIDEEMEVKEGAEPAINVNEIRDLRVGASGRIRGALVQIFETKPVFKVCPECGKGVEDVCEEHGKSAYRMVVSGVMDDGTGNIRAVFFGEDAEKVAGIGANDVGDDVGFVRFFERLKERVGEEFVVNGRVKVNKFFDRLEFIVNGVESVDVSEEIKALVGELNG